MISERELLEFIQNSDDPFVTAKDVATGKGMAQNTALKHLRKLHDSGRINKKKIGGSAVVWWLPERCS
jgi:predicted ArsR family transcriptional regulator